MLAFTAVVVSVKESIGREEAIIHAGDQAGEL
jgi:hypothetical protein